MTTSGTYTFNYARDQIIRAALRKVGAIQAGETPGPQMVTDCADALNSMVKFWETSGIHIWTTSEAIMYTQIGQAVYPLGAGTPTQATVINATTTLTANVAASALTITVASNYQVSNGVSIGIIMDSGSVFWTTVASFVGTTITLSSAITDSATSGNYVYVVSSNITRPLRIPALRRWNTLSQIETPCIPLSRLDYQALPNKTIQGTVTQFWYDPQGGANNYGNLYLWPTPADVVNNNVKFTWLRPIQDFNTALDTPDFPQEWISTLIWNLALDMAPEFGVPSEIYLMIKDRAESTLAECQMWDKEPEPANFGVDFQRMGM